MDLLLVVAVSLLMPPLAWFTEGPLRIAVGGAFLLFLPGYALIAALYPLRRSLNVIERIGLSFGLSIAVVPLIGLALNYSSGAIGVTPLLLSVLAFTLCMCGIAAARRSRVAPADRFSVPFSKPRIDWRSMDGKDRVSAGMVALSVVVFVGAVAFVVTRPHEAGEFTEFYVLGPGGWAAGYPESVPVGESAKVTLGIVNRQAETLSYRVDAWLDGDPDGLALSVAGPDVTMLSPSSFVLGDLGADASWESTVELTPRVPGEQLKAELLLYSPRPRVDEYVRVRLGENGYVLLQIDEAGGRTELTVKPPDAAGHACRVEAWQDDRLIAEAEVVADGREESVQLDFPPGETAFRVYDAETLVVNDRGEELSLHLWIDVPERGPA
jgi:uncharacterized membrane protein